MPRIEAEAADGTKTFEAEQGRKLVLAIEDNGIDILHRCGGNAKCTTCRVEVLAGDLRPICSLRMRKRSESLSAIASQWRRGSPKTYASPARCVSTTT